MINSAVQEKLLNGAGEGEKCSVGSGNFFNFHYEHKIIINKHTDYNANYFPSTPLRGLSAAKLTAPLVSDSHLRRRTLPLEGRSSKQNYCNSDGRSLPIAKHFYLESRVLTYSRGSTCESRLLIFKEEEFQVNNYSAIGVRINRLNGSPLHSESSVILKRLRFITDPKS